MSKRIGNMIFIEPTEDEACESCGKQAECRPYGPNGENVCYDCGMKNPEAAERQMRKILFGEEVN